MSKFILFIVGLIALGIFIATIGPLILLGLSGFLLYFVFKQFMKSESTGRKVFWVVIGLIALSMVLSNIYAVVGLIAFYAIYKIITMFKREDYEKPDDPFTNFEKEWSNI